MARGSCLCGNVQLEINGPMRPVVACHCTQCRKQSGHHYAATNCADGDLVIRGEENMTWFHATASAKRGFCSTCGSALIWKHEDDDHTSIMAGCLDEPTGLKLEKHIFVESKGDYYDIADGVEQVRSPASPSDVFGD